MDVVLILLNYNDYHNTRKYIDFCTNYKDIYKIIVVDNCSNDNSFEKLSLIKNDKFDLIKTDKNGGYAYGNNFGIKYAKEKYNPKFFIISNPDVYFEEKIIKQMVNQIGINSEIGIISPKVSNINQNLPLAWKLPKYIDSIISLSIFLDKIFRKKRYYNKEHFNTEISCVDVIPGSFFMIKSDVIFEVDLFDENTFLFGEENILSYKLIKKGYKNYIINNCAYIHNHSESINKSYKSYNEKYKILYNSLDYYNKVYLNTNKIQNLFLYIFFRLSVLEKLIISILKK